jgi:SWIM zinc finger
MGRLLAEEPLRIYEVQPCVRYEVGSEHDPDVVYDVELEHGHWRESCSCSDWHYRQRRRGGRCKHLRAVEALIESRLSRDQD